MIAGRLAHALVAGGNFSALRTAHETIRKAAPHLAEDDFGDVLPFLLDLAEQVRRYPTWRELEEYISHSPKLGLDPSYRTSLADNLKQLVKLNVGETASPDVVPQLVEQLVTEGQIAYWKANWRTAGGIGAQGNPVPGDKNSGLNPPRSEWVKNAQRYLAEQAKNDFALPPQAPEGGWKENAALATDALIASLDTPTNRCLTGLRHIDAAVAIDRRSDCRCVGILGYTNEGKSQLMRTIAYNMASSGKRVLHIPLEESPQAVWEQFSFLHSYHRPDLDIPPQAVWKSQPHKITMKHKENLRELIRDLQSGKTVTGEIVVMRRMTWPEIVQEVNAGHNNQEWDCVFIDYLAHLETGNPAKKHEIISATFDHLQALSGSYAGGKGVVIVTGLQAGKKYADAAAAEEGEDWGVYPQGAIDWYTNANHALDLIISIFNRKPAKDMGLVKLACYKVRGAASFPPHFVQVDKRTRRILDLPGKPVGNHLDIKAQREEEKRKEQEAEWNSTINMDVEVKIAPIAQPAPPKYQGAGVLSAEKLGDVSDEQKVRRAKLDARLAAMSAK